jgi:SAM-dependent methyltransferase
MSEWKAYNELAWTEKWLADPKDYKDEVARYVSLLRKYSSAPPKTLLHLGSGAGGHDRFFRDYFQVTGVDLSPGMQDLARAANPNVEYIPGDMRTIRLNKQFDAVVIPDSIDYMTTESDLRLAIETAVLHLKPGGVLLVVGKMEETFENNSFAYCGEKNGIHITLLENNHVYPDQPHSYEAVFIYLIRQKGLPAIHIDRHLMGLFPGETWDKVFREAGIIVDQKPLDGVYDNYLLAEGRYPMTIFIGQKP